MCSANGFEVATQCTNQHHISEGRCFVALQLLELLHQIHGISPVLAHQSQQASDGQNVFTLGIQTQTSITQGVGQGIFAFGHQGLNRFPNFHGGKPGNILVAHHATCFRCADHFFCQCFHVLLLNLG